MQHFRRFPKLYTKECSNRFRVSVLIHKAVKEKARKPFRQLSKLSSLNPTSLKPLLIKKDDGDVFKTKRSSVKYFYLDFRTGTEKSVKN